MKTNTSIALNFVRAQKAKRPTNEEVQRAIQLANEKYRNGHRQFEPTIYTR